MTPSCPSSDSKGTTLLPETREQANSNGTTLLERGCGLEGTGPRGAPAWRCDGAS
jgi:hypothetical protein